MFEHFRLAQSRPLQDPGEYRSVLFLKQQSAIRPSPSPRFPCCFALQTQPRFPTFLPDPIHASSAVPLLTHFSNGPPAALDSWARLTSALTSTDIPIFHHTSPRTEPRHSQACPKRFDAVSGRSVRVRLICSVCRVADGFGVGGSRAAAGRSTAVLHKPTLLQLPHCSTLAFTCTTHVILNDAEAGLRHGPNVIKSATAERSSSWTIDVASQGQLCSNSVMLGVKPYSTVTGVCWLTMIVSALRMNEVYISSKLISRST